MHKIVGAVVLTGHLGIVRVKRLEPPSDAP
jgi:hypothetical protein